MTVEGSDRVGSVAEEAARLLGFSPQVCRTRTSSPPVHGWQVRPWTPTSVGVRARPARCVRDPDSVCRICPICRVLTVVKAISPETLEKIADVVDLLSDGLRGLRPAVGLRPLERRLEPCPPQ